MKKFSPFISWLQRGSNMESLYDSQLADPNLEYGGFLTLSSATPLYKAGNLEAESLETCWKLAKKYTEDVRGFLNLEEDVDLECLDNYEIDLIVADDELSNPPPVAHPIYLMTVQSDTQPERIEYIGKTSSKNSRFRGGHAAITKLHAPQYEGLEKKIYMASILLLANSKALLPLEWIQPLDKATQLLKQIEGQLITSYQPELNELEKNHDLMRDYIQLHIQNKYGSMFLNDTFCVFHAIWTVNPVEAGH